MAVDAHDRLFVANPGHGQVWGVDAHGLPLFRIDCTAFGRMPTNCCFTPDGTTLLITESQSGSVLAAEIPPPSERVLVEANYSDQVTPPDRSLP